MCSSGMPAARAVGVRTPGRDCLRVLGLCQNTTWRPRAMVCTSCDRFSRARAATTSMAAPRRLQLRSSTRSTTTGSAGQSAMSRRWQYSALVRGHTSEVAKTSPAPTGSRIR
ncbi:Uncharacterised protein [Mycobacterium tuberculosis]|uniref:Uncharacterized protein n=1 Tax=Mycobacterium tuberculosis TaxID=1773 RepID=A0A655JB77_MYCTX|nr:Uncharacterised protein [Mycobacterium tuberculosis]CKQ89628.1 Uncharacterised protein [Mycobacterium tuberculosis]CKS23304.1 Uncharacterised protein [Mycobacterium tuberculosis]CKT23812.1 Uncharacterised protein [Mycobacterium tuberculosis]CKT42219.1 Uncharacterised protein [Mycobacterium tuberculosis]